jgi:putative endopeptidase
MQSVRSMLVLLFFVCVAAAQNTATVSIADNHSSSAGPTEPKMIPSLDLSAIDKTVDPCTDFYEYACGSWRKANPIPNDQARWARSFSLLGDRNRYLLYQQLVTAAKPDAKRTPLQAQYGDFYAACMNASMADEKGLKPIQPQLDKIASLSDKTQLPSLIGALQTEGTTLSLFRLVVQPDEKNSSQEIASVGQSGLALPDRDYYIENTPRFQTIRQQYLEHMTKMFVLAGDSPEQAAGEAEAVLKIETALAQGSMSRVALRDPEARYHIMSLAELQQLSPDFQWQEYLRLISIGKFETLNVATPDFFKALNAEINSQSLAAWKSYLRWHVLTGYAAYLSSSFDNENFNFFGKTLAGQREETPRWKRCTILTDSALGEAVGQDWVKKNFPPAAKENMDKLVLALEKALAEDIQTLPWMSDETKKAAEEKLKLIRNKIGYPEHWRDYSRLTVRADDLVGNISRSNVFQRNYNLDKLGKPVDEKEWGMTPPTVNAYYNQSMNDINFPAGILQPPFFDNEADPAVNFGGIGVVIGHEMTHGFDDQGSKYDGHGNLREWQTAEDRKNFVARTDCEVAEYSGFDAAAANGNTPAQKVNGKLTLGENTADNGGIRIAYLALMESLAEQGKLISSKIDGYTEAQRFFLSFGQIWCENTTDQSARQSALTDPHSPGRWRVNGTVQNFEEFGKAFGCKKGHPMYPENACRVW